MNPKKIAGFAIGPIGGALIGFVTLPVITWYFSQEDVGRISMLQISVSFCVLFFSLGLDQAYVREFHEYSDKTTLFMGAISPGILILVPVLFVFLFFLEDVSIWLFDRSDRFLGMLSLFAILVAFISRFLSLILRMQERGLAYSMSQLAPKLLLFFTICVYIFFGFEKNLKNLVFAYVMSMAFVCVVYAINTRKEWMGLFFRKLDTQKTKKMLRFGIPLVLGSAAYWGLTATDKILLRVMSNFAELGVYSVAVSFAAVAGILQNIFTTVWAPIVYKWVSEGEDIESIKKVSRYVLATVVLMFCLGGLFSWVVSLVLPKNYSDVQWIFVSCLGAPLLYMLSETTVMGIGVSRRSAYSAIASLMAFLINLVGNWLLIPKYGAAGAAASTCIAFWMFLILRTEFSIYLWRPMPRFLLYLYSGMVVFFSVVFSMYGKEFGGAIILIWFSIFVSCFFVFKEEVQKSFLFIKRLALRESDFL